MNYFARLCLCALVAVVVLIGLSGVFASFFGRELSVFDLSRGMVIETRRSEALRNRSDMVARSLTIKNAIVDELLAERLSLSEAAEQFQDANDMVENGDPNLLADYRKPDTEEGVNEQVIAWVRNEIWHRPSVARTRIAAALEDKFQKRFGHPCPNATLATEEDQRMDPNIQYPGMPVSRISE
jgi:hypothetical protein